MEWLKVQALSSNPSTTHKKLKEPLLDLQSYLCYPELNREPQFLTCQIYWNLRKVWVLKSPK
jgi:hypothetical protein